MIEAILSTRRSTVLALAATAVLWAAAADAGAAGGGSEGASDGPPAAELARLDWMAGHWRRDAPDLSSEELWMAPEGGLMIGLGRTLREGRAVGFEFLRIEQRETRLVYLASPGGRPATEFPLRALEDQRVVFENQQHDFPQRILYWREGEDLCARIEGEIGGEARQMSWCWSLVSPAPLPHIPSQ